MQYDPLMVKRCLEGDGEAWDFLTQFARKVTLSQTLRFRLMPADAEDVLQEVLLEIHTELGKIRDPMAFPAWLKAVSAHKCMAWKRAQHESQELDGTDKGRAIPSRILDDLESKQLLNEAMRRLPMRCRVLIQLLFIRGLDYDEVALELKIAVGSVGFIRGRCLGKLRVAMRQMGVLPE
jgi:RNA polymerase sigma factor (sigma-70 family)